MGMRVSWYLEEPFFHGDVDLHSTRKSVFSNFQATDGDA